MSGLALLLTGAIAMGSFVAGLVFMRFWRQTRDAFFLCFGVSFWLEAGNRLALGLLPHTDESEPSFYLLRLAAYGLILYAIWQKNRPRN
jgi:hypothetical protein